MSKKAIDPARNLFDVPVSRRTLLQRSLLGGGSLMASTLLGGLSARWALGAEASPIVETTAGKVRGATIDGVQTFKGIHYGESTAGSVRFLPPKAAKSWTGVREATEYGPPAPQNVATQDLAANNVQAAIAGSAAGFGRLLLGPGTMSEDCLVLNVWTPNLRTAIKKPVMFWLHGGGFAAGSDGRSWFDGTNLARKHLGDLGIALANDRPSFVTVSNLAAALAIDPQIPGVSPGAQIYNPKTVIVGKPGEWYNPYMFTLPAFGTLGDVPRAVLIGPQLANWDFSLNKDTALPKLGEKGRTEFRAEFFNIINHTNFDFPGISQNNENFIQTGIGTGIVNPAAGVVSTTATNARQIQFGLRLEL